MSEIADRSRLSRRRWARPGSSHDRVVRGARLILPAAVGALTAILALAPLLGDNEISFVLAKDKVAITRDRMRVSEAVYRGADNKGQAFALSAGSAVQVSTADPIVRLQDLSARIALPEGPATLRAGRGRYDMQSEQVAVDGPILFQAADGYQLETSDVRVDLPARTLRSEGGVQGRMPLGTFSGDRMRADLGERTVTLEGRARLRVVQGAIR